MFSFCLGETPLTLHAPAARARRAAAGGRGAGISKRVVVYTNLHRLLSIHILFGLQQYYLVVAVIYLHMAEAGREAHVSSDASPTIKPKVVEKVRPLQMHLLSICLTCVHRP